MGLVSSRIPDRSRLKGSNHRKQDGNPAQKVEHVAKLSVSSARRLCSNVVPVRGCPVAI